LKCGLGCLNERNPAEQRLDGIRLVQLALGDIGSKKSIGTIWEGYTSRRDITDTDTAKKLAALFPSGQADLDRELARTLGMLSHDDAGLRLRVLERCSGDSSPSEDIHYLAVYARLSGIGTDKEAKIVACTLLDLDRKIAARKLNRDSNWPLRLQELYAGLSEKDPAPQQAMLDDPSFGRPDHALFTTAKNFPRERATRIFLERWKSDAQYPLNGAIVQLFEAVPAEEVLPTLRKRWGETGQEAALLPLLARQPQPEDRRKFLDGLNSLQAATLEACVLGLNRLDAKADGPEAFALIRALHRTTDKQLQLRNIIADRLAKNTGNTFGADSKRWSRWLEEKHPELAQRLNNPDGVDVAKWTKRLASLDWDRGQAAAGKAIFGKSCIHCHSGSQAIGPDLAGATQRFSRADLFTAIVQPSKDVPARYQTTVVETSDGKTYQGIVIYDAVDSLILQTGAATTIRVPGSKIAGRHVSAQSLMPAGLLDPLRDQDIVDLYAYLREIGKGSSK
jgi:putative heme-binding domain-containing protein